MTIEEGLAVLKAAGFVAIRKPAVSTYLSMKVKFMDRWGTPHLRRLSSPYWSDNNKHLKREDPENVKFWMSYLVKRTLCLGKSSPYLVCFEDPLWGIEAEKNTYLEWARKRQLKSGHKLENNPDKGGNDGADDD